MTSFWRMHALWPAVILAVALAVIRVTGLDLVLADGFFGAASRHAWLGANRWWAVDLIHGGGAMLVRVAGLAAIVAWIVCARVPRWREWRRAWAYVAIGMALCATTVGGLKQITNMDCPRDLARYGGDRPYMRLFGDRPDELPRAACWPGAHASSGFSLVAFYFALRDRRPRLARIALAGSAAVWVVFSLGQEARGAHFLSHDLVGAALVWFLLLALYRWLPGTGLQWAHRGHAAPGIVP